MTTIDQYTTRWDAPTARAPRLGSLVRADHYADGREWHGFSRALDRAGRGLAFVREMPRAQVTVYRVVRAVGDVEVAP
jgi:hypothetical protein